MNIDDRSETSAEMLRLAIPLITKHGSGFTPLSYAIWYEYVRGSNSELKSDIDTALIQSPKLTFAMTFELYQKHVADKAEQQLGKTRIEIIELIAKLNSKLSEAGDGTAEFGQHLTEFSNKLNTPVSVEELKNSVGLISSQVENMDSTISSMHKELTDTHTVVQKLTDELKRVREESLIDALSQVKNRRAYELALVDFMSESRQSGEPVCAIIFDIDHFKKVNDSYGHLFGDKVIRAVAQLIKGNIKGKDLVARFGGEEFVVLLPATKLAGAVTVANQIRDRIEHVRIKKYNSSESVGAITVSAGVSQLNDSDDARSFIERADRGLYEAKESGRNRVCAGSGQLVEAD